jgi:hypothetical protein
MLFSHRNTEDRLSTEAQAGRGKDSENAVPKKRDGNHRSGMLQGSRPHADQNPAEIQRGGYTVGKNEKRIGEYIRQRLQEDLAADEISMKEYIDPLRVSRRRANRRLSRWF